MDLKFEEFTHFFSNPPHLSQLMGKTHDARKSGRVRKLLFIVPSYKDTTRLRRLLAELARQTSADFDVAVIYGPHDEFVTVDGVSVLHVQRKIDAGITGAIYLGQLIAIRDNYEYHLATDVDKYPCSPESLQLLLQTADSQKADCTYGRFRIDGLYVTFSNQYVEYDTPVIHDPTWFLWAVVRTSFAHRIGLILLPLYFGSEEVEYGTRLFDAGGKHAYIDTPVFRMYTPKHEDRYLNLLRNGGRDYTVAYSITLGLYNFPRIYFSRLSERLPRGLMHKVTSPLRLLRVLLYHDWFTAHLMAARVPEFSVYVENAKAMRFGIFDWPKENEHVEITKVAPKDISANLLVRSDCLSMKGAPSILRSVCLSSKSSLTMRKIAFFIKNILFRYTPLFPSSELNLFWLFLFDTLFVYDEKNEEYFRVRWRRRFSRWDLIQIAIRLEYECILLYLKILLGLPKDRVGVYAASIQV